MPDGRPVSVVADLRTVRVTPARFGLAPMKESPIFLFSLTVFYDDFCLPSRIPPTWLRIEDEHDGLEEL